MLLHTLQTELIQAKRMLDSLPDTIKIWPNAQNKLSLITLPKKIKVLERALTELKLIEREKEELCGSINVNNVVK
ncbi:hypothetical protein LCGC14_2927500 [marine sediment metagenome]|uniref:Uncharacterized protein n=1 Tax=marine sediment metagenome TaxID=412755 RepID=A0A0F8Y8R8_9ZZZZ